MDDYNKQFVALMQESGWLPEDIVRELGITKGAVSQYRSGKTRPSLTVLRLFGARTNLPLALIDGESKETDQIKTRLEPWEISSLESLRQLKPDIRMEIVGHIARLAKLFNSDVRQRMEALASTQSDKDLERLMASQKKTDTPHPSKTRATRNILTTDESPPGQARQ